MEIVINLGDLRNELAKAEKQRQETITSLKKQRLDYQNQIGEIDNILLILEEKEVHTPKASGKGRGPRRNNKYTISEGVELLTKKYVEGLTREQIVEKMISEIGYKTTSSITDFNNTVYCAGINKLVKGRVLIPVGTRPNTLYKHVKNVTTLERIQAGYAD